MKVYTHAEAMALTEPEWKVLKETSDSDPEVPKKYWTSEIVFAVFHVKKGRVSVRAATFYHYPDTEWLAGRWIVDPDYGATLTYDQLEQLHAETCR